MRILVDMDGIVCDTLPAWLNRIYETTGIQVDPLEINKWNLMENPLLSQLQPSQVFDILNEEGFTRSIPEMPDACLFLEKLHNAGHDISIVTARFGTNCMPETLVWLREMMPWFNAEKKTFFCYDKHRITGDILIDDREETLLTYRKEHPDAKLITIDYAYNQNVSVDKRILHNGYEWEAIESYIGYRLKEKE